MTANSNTEVRTITQSLLTIFCLQKTVLAIVGTLSKGFMSLLTATEIEGQQTLQQAFSRPAEQGMITVSNHTAALDDPLLLAAMMPEGSLLKPELFRWGMCATDRCFKTDLMSAFFRAGKVTTIALLDYSCLSSRPTESNSSRHHACQYRKNLQYAQNMASVTALS